MSSGSALSQEEILSSVKTVSQGLEALIAEHQQILVGLASSADSIKKESGDASFVEQKAQIITKSVDSLELGIGEAQVGSSCCLYFSPPLEVVDICCVPLGLETSFPVGNIVPLKSEMSYFQVGNSEFCEQPRLPRRKYELGNTSFRAQWNAAIITHSHTLNLYCIKTPL